MALLRRPERGAPPFSVSGSRDDDGTVRILRRCGFYKDVSSRHVPRQLSTKVRPQIAQVTRTQMRFSFSAQASLPLALSPLTMEGPLSEAGGGEDLVVSVAEERDKVLLALLDLAQRLVVRLTQPLDHGRDSACGVGA